VSELIPTLATPLKLEYMNIGSRFIVTLFGTFTLRLAEAMVVEVGNEKKQEARRISVRVVVIAGNTRAQLPATVQLVKAVT
jgi:hypothetical protein